MGKEKEKRRGTSRRIVSMEPGADPPISGALSAFRNIREEKLENVRKTTTGSEREGTGVARIFFRESSFTWCSREVDFNRYYRR